MMTRAALIHAIPTVLTFTVLIAVGWWGHRHQWTVTKPISASATEEKADWCAEHSLLESECLLCRKSLAKAQNAREPSAQVAKDEEIRFAQVASVEMLAKANITTLVTSTTMVEPSLVAPAESVYEPTRVARMSSRVSGTIRLMSKRLGDVVAVGDVLAVIESAEVGRVKSQLMHALAEQAVAKATADRARASAESGFRTAGEAREALGRLQAAQIAVFDAEQGLLNLGLTVSAAELADLDPAAMALRLRSLGLPAGMVTHSANLLAMTAPRAGTITALAVGVDEGITAGELLAVVADTKQLCLKFALAPSQALNVKVGQTVRFTTADGIPASGHVTVVASAADETTRWVPVLALIDNDDGRLRANQVGNVTVVLGAPQATVIVPAAAVQYDGPTAYLFIQRKPTIFRGLAVRVLATTAAGVAVDRVIPGDVVAITGTDVLKGNLFQDKFGPGCCAE